MQSELDKQRHSEDDCYVRLRESIRMGVVLPNQRLIETDLARTFGVGRTAIRTALTRLEQEGIVEREPHRGARVRLISEKEALEILEVRAALESVAVRYAALRCAPEDAEELEGFLATMKECYETSDLLRYSDTNGRLHRKLLQMANHTTVSRVLESLHTQNVRFQYRTILVPKRPEKSLAEHSAIVAAVVAHNADEAEQAMRTHLSHVIDALGEAITHSLAIEQSLP